MARTAKCRSARSRPFGQKLPATKPSFILISSDYMAFYITISKIAETADICTYEFVDHEAGRGVLQIRKDIQPSVKLPR